MGGKSTKARAVYVVCFSGERDAEAVFRSVQPEALSTPTKRARVRVFREGAVIRIEVEALDLVALRALTNSFLRFLACSYNTLVKLGLSEKT